MTYFFSSWSKLIQWHARHFTEGIQFKYQTDKISFSLELGIRLLLQGALCRFWLRQFGKYIQGKDGQNNRFLATDTIIYSKDERTRDTTYQFFEMARNGKGSFCVPLI